MPNTCTPWMIDALTSLMSEGKTQKEVCAAIGITEETFLQWKKPSSANYEKDFHEAFTMAKLHQFAWWADKGRSSLTDRDFSTPLYALFMANMFGWRSGGSKDDEAMQEIRKLKEQMGIEDS